MPPKRKATSSLLERRVRPRREEEWDPEEVEESSGGSGSDDDVSEEDAGRGGRQSGSESSVDGDSDSDEESDDDETPKVDVSSISFGALARAQASLPPLDRKSKSKMATDLENDSSLNPTTRKDEPSSSRLRKKDARPPKRTSKHAPQEQPSKRPVSRRRDVVSLPDARRGPARDPRFDPVGAGRLDEGKARRAYAFLEEYREKELLELRQQLKKTKDEAQRESLKREIMSMESRKKARQKRDEGENVLAEHKKKEKEMVAQGKKPFYLKKSEQKKQALTNRFESMSKGQVDRAIERKRKKVAGKEKKELGDIQRITDRRQR